MTTTKVTLAKALNMGLRKAMEADDLGHHLREGCKALPDPKPLDQFGYVFSEMTEELAAQRDGFAAYLESFEESHA